MAKDYKHAANKKPGQAPGALHKLLPFLTGLALGLLATFAIYLVQQDNSWRPFQSKTPPPASRTAAQPPATAQTPAKTPAAPAPEASQVPAPRFDFYNILPNKEINISEWEAEEQTLEQTLQQPGHQDPNSVFILQVGSFKQLEAADQVKAQLALIGVTADIQRVVINGQDSLYRVRVGPYSDQQKLNEARLRLQENNLEFMLLKLQADDPRAVGSEG